MRKEQKLMLVFAIIMAFIVTAVFLPGMIDAGSLDPPDPAVDLSGNPVSTMYTLTEIYDKLEGIDNRLEEMPCESAFVAKTGQTISYHPHDDGALEKGKAWPNPRFTDNQNGTVTDNLTELIWLKNADRFGKLPWNDACDVCSVLAADVQELTDGSVAGDWRLPNLKELNSLIHYGFFSPAVSNTAGTDQLTSGDPFFFNLDELQSNNAKNYWSSTSHAMDPTYAAPLDFYDGMIYYLPKTSGLHVWCVRGGL